MRLLIAICCAFTCPDWLEKFETIFKLAIGVYKIQGFEKCNSELKHIFQNNTNKEIMFMQCMTKLQCRYKYEDY